MVYQVHEKKGMQGMMGSVISNPLVSHEEGQSFMGHVSLKQKAFTGVKHLDIYMHTVCSKMGFVCTHFLPEHGLGPYQLCSIVFVAAS